ncbi:terminase small subunit [Eubacterium callanderi]|nr:terminase small subunit [Eubacterium callanderi]MCB6660233.1 terminase small subunit [Eubacterium callanderi]MCB6753176.1 terminase small subunit [Eubacterium callanderi]MCB7105056.1 terminase small subunit [Eubacterium callanderi]MCG4820601.1 terminase small subunit [Eubacterium callanderi]MCQ5190475.1 terminase small subunit [Eubacterium callanderi]
MTEKQKRFADEYLIDLNGTRAYKVAYPSVKKDQVAATNAGRLLRNAEVKTYIDEQLEKIHNEKTADAQEVLEYLTAVMRNEQTEEVVVVEGTGDGCSEARTMEKDTSIKDRVKAAELLGKRYSLFTDKMELATGDIVLEIGEWDDDG